MKTIKALAILGFASALVLTASVPAAVAKKLGGAGAKAISDSDTSCANYSYGSLQNSCATTKSFMVPMTFDTAGYKTLSFRAKGATSSNNVGCKGTSTTDAGGMYTTPTVYLSQFGSVMDVSVGDLYVDGTNPAYFNCSIDNSGKLVLVEWEE